MIEFSRNLWRMLDANLNRATEGLRVAEDIARFALADARLTEALKDLRHAVAAAFEPVAWEKLLASRDAASDVGRELLLPSEAHRDSLDSLLRANLERAKQAFRVLEEITKMLPDQGLTNATGPPLQRMASSHEESSPAVKGLPSVSARLEACRYRLYDLERELGLALINVQRWERRHLYVLTDGCESNAAFTDYLEALLAGGVDIIQLRDKQLDDRRLLERSHRLVELCRPQGVLTIINDRPDLALLAEADGVHVGQDELSVGDCRDVIRPHMVVGLSTHSAEQFAAARREGADYVGVGPLFGSQTKQFRRTLGIPLLEQIQAVGGEPLPWFAIGGIDGDNLDQVLAAGARRIAVSGATRRAQDPEAETRRLKAMLLEAAEADQFPERAGGPGTAAPDLES